MSTQLLKRTDVEQLIGFKKTFIYKEMSEGRFPQPMKVGRSVRWKQKDIENWMNSLKLRGTAA